MTNWRALLSSSGAHRVGFIEPARVLVPHHVGCFRCDKKQAAKTLDRRKPMSQHQANRTHRPFNHPTHASGGKQRCQNNTEQLCSAAASIFNHSTRKHESEREKREDRSQTSGERDERLFFSFCGCVQKSSSRRAPSSAALKVSLLIPLKPDYFKSWVLSGGSARALARKKDPQESPGSRQTYTRRYI